jgi:hypothetical protein
MTGRAHRLVAFLGKAEPRRPPSGWALALDAAIAVAAAVGAVMEVADRTLQNLFVGPGGAIMTQPVTVHAPAAALAAAALTALPLAARRLYPIMAWLVIAAAITAIAFSPHAAIPPVASGTAVFAAYSAVLHSRYRNLAIAAVLAVAAIVTSTFGDLLPRSPPGSASGNCAGGCWTPGRSCAAPRRSTRPPPTAPSTPSAPASPAKCMTS